MNAASALYAAVARRRRAWYARHPESRRRLARPVISVGNVAVGGSGKTPLVAHLARLLLEAGEHPAILSRGYARRVADDGVTVVSDGLRILADLDRAGDEPLMLARALPGVSVLVAADRYLAGRLAERRLGCTVHLLDDGFQHFGLMRDVDLVVVGRQDLERPVTLPAGRLREPLNVLDAADALLLAADAGEMDAAGDRFAGTPRFRLVQEEETARLVDGAALQGPAGAGRRAFVVSGIARPERFRATVERQGWTVAGALTFRDHHRFTRADVAAIDAGMRQAGAELVLTTEKDLVRLLPLRPWPMSIAWIPLRVSVEPAVEFREWLRERLARRAVSGHGLDTPVS